MIKLLNTSILTTAGKYDFQQITLQEAKEILEGQEVDSAIGHKSTADILSALLEREIEVNRQTVIQEAGETVLVFKLNGRPEEGKILTVEEIEEIGYSFYTLKRER